MANEVTFMTLETEALDRHYLKQQLIDAMNAMAESSKAPTREHLTTMTPGQENTLANGHGANNDNAAKLLKKPIIQIHQDRPALASIASRPGTASAGPSAPPPPPPSRVASVNNGGDDAAAAQRAANDKLMQKIFNPGSQVAKQEQELEPKSTSTAIEQAPTSDSKEHLGQSQDSLQIQLLQKQLEQAKADLVRKDVEMVRARAVQPGVSVPTTYRAPNGRRDNMHTSQELEPASANIWGRSGGNPGLNYGNLHANYAHALGRLPEATQTGYPSYNMGQVGGQRIFSDPASNGIASLDSMFEDMHQPSRRRGESAATRNTSYSARNGLWNQQPSVISGSSGVTPLYLTSPASAYQQYGVQYNPRPIGTPLSPTASEFGGRTVGAAWNDEGTGSGRSTYFSPSEPINWRQLLEKNVSCDWKFIVDKIICNNDQQASIFLQQKLKLANEDQKHEIIDAIIAQCYPLMVNRFGNFLVQRCFEHGAPDQILGIAKAIRGNTLALSMDPFGCHVIQKAFDCVPESFKAVMVHELLRRIPETVIHRYACHVWQKLFELRWQDSPPQIMRCVNDALTGIWHEVAMGETGSLVVQNIFENCLEEDKRPCINEVLASIDMISRGQFGNWCIQHICEHGAPADRSRAVEHVLRNAESYSMDQYASKVVEKNLRIGGAEFLGRYLDQVCQGSANRPRIPLIDISSDQYGNYLIQWILTHAQTLQHREIVQNHIRKHMVSLRGSKFGSRVGMLCNDTMGTTRPGPVNPVMMPNRFVGPRYGAGYR